MLLTAILITVLFILCLVLGYFFREIKEPYFDYDWSVNWSKYDKAARIDADCKPIYKIHRKMGEQSLWIWTTPKTCEQGLPHTRGIDVIAIPDGYPQEHLPPLLDHEHVHILQRLMPDSWAKFYQLKWFYRIYSEPPVGMPKELIKFRRANPDTANEPYCCWKSRWWPVAVYKSEKSLSLSGAPVKWWDQETGKISTEPPEAWVAFFGSVHQSEHPHEISAEYLSGPLRLGKRPETMPAGMKVLADSWKEGAQFPIISNIKDR
jgi:hypothetical protein